MSGGVGILGVGVHLPAEIRTNDWWPAALVEHWRALRAQAPAPALPPDATPAMQRVFEAMRQGRGDVFFGVLERRVMPADQVATDMETAAAEQALARAGVEPSAVDALLVHSAVPSYLLANAACNLHARLGLPRACLALEAQASAYSFLGQLALATALIRSGQATYVLLVQSTAATRLIAQDDPRSPAFGDAASAVLVGRVGDGRGVLSAVHRADGRVPDTLVASVPGARWYDGRPVLHIANPAGDRRIMLETVDQGREVVTAALAAAGTPASDVSFFAVHQGTPWLRRLTQEEAGIAQARTVDLFSRIGYVFAASLPLVLDAAVHDGLLNDGDLAVAFGGGTGMTCGATVLRWGRS